MPVDLEENRLALQKLASAGEPNMSVDPGMSVAVPAPQPTASSIPSSIAAGWQAPMALPAEQPTSSDDTSWLRNAKIPQPVAAQMGPFFNQDNTLPKELPSAPGAPVSNSSAGGNVDFGKYMAQSFAMGKPAGSSFVSSDSSEATPQSPSPPLQRIVQTVKTSVKSPGPAGVGSNLGALREAVAKSPTEIAEAQKLALINQAEFGQQMADAHEADRVRMEAYDLARKENEDRRQAAISKANADIDQSQKEADSFKVHDGGFLERNPGAVLTAIGAIFGGALAARTGQPNQALNTLDTMINRDIQAQKDQLAQKNAKTAGLVNSLGRMRELFKDEKTAELGEEMAIRRQLNDKLEGIVQSSKNQQMRDQGEVILKEGRAKETQIRYEMLQRQAAAAAAQAAEERKTQLEFTKMAIQHAYKVAEEGPGKFDKEQKDLKETYVPGYGFAATTDQALKLKAATGVQDMVRNQIPAIIKEYEDLGVMGRMADVDGRRTALEQRLGGLMAAVKNEIVKTGTSMTEGEAALIGATQNDVKDWFDIRGRVSGKLNTFKQMVDDNVASQLKNASIERGTVQTIQHPFTGQPTPYYMKTGSVIQNVPRVADIGTKETKK